MNYYKYTPVEFIDKCIEKGIYASTLDAVNDPYEIAGINCPNNYRIVCLTTKPDDMLMWSYYGNHAGCCVEFDLSGIDGIREVKYNDDYLRDDNMSEERTIECLYRKSEVWKNEHEYRLVYCSENCKEKYWDRERDVVYLKAKAKRIIFGLFSDKDFKYDYMIDYLMKNNVGTNRIEISKYRIKEGCYQLEVDSTFDIKEEYKNIGKKRPRFKYGRVSLYDGSYSSNI